VNDGQHIAWRRADTATDSTGAQLALSVGGIEIEFDK
jgi:hypothetical protein